MSELGRLIAATAALLALAPVSAIAVVGPTPPPIAPIASPPVLVSPSPSPVPSPTPTAPPTPQGQLSIDPSSAPPAATLHLIGSGFPGSKSFTVLFDTRPFTAVSTDAGGAFTKDVTVPDFASGPDHQICVQEPSGGICAGFHLQPAVSPSPSLTPTPEPSPVATPSPADTASPGPGSDFRTAPPAAGSPLDPLTRPPGIFFPILLLLAIAIGAGYWFLALRKPGPMDVTVEHRAAPERTGGLPSGSAIAPPAVPPAEPPPAPIVYETPAGPEAQPPPPRHPTPPPGSGADVPPDLPEASD